MIFIVCEYSKFDGMRVRGVYEREGSEAPPEAKEHALNLWERQRLAFGNVADFVIQAWLPGQFEVNSRGERDHTIWSAATYYEERLKGATEWTPPQLTPSLT